MFSYPVPASVIPRADPPPYLPSLVTFDLEDLIGTTILNGTEVLIESVLPNDQDISYSSVVYDGKLTTNLLMTEGSHVNLIFSNSDFFSETITITDDQYFDGFGALNQTNSLAFTVALAPKDPCTPPISGDWVVSVSCELTSDATVTGNVTITNNSQIEIASGNTLTISSDNNITIEAGSGLKIISGGTLQVNS